MHVFHRIALSCAVLVGVLSGAGAYAAEAAAPAAKPGAIESAVIQVFSTVRQPDTVRPWSKQPPQSISGSGVVIEGKRILTNAHVVGYASQVQIQANQAGDKLSATVEAISPGIDLAVLKLDDESFFDTHPPVARANILPDVKDAVLAYGYPLGGNSLSITKGIVSRIEFVAYRFPVSALRIQIDAAINPGNSGGPVMAGDKMIGLAFSGASNAQNIGYIIPNEEIELFLRDVADGRYDGKPAMFDEMQTFENPALRTFLKLDKTVSGMIVDQPASRDPAYPLKEWDVITHIGETPIDNQGMVKINANLRVRFQYLIQKVAKNGLLPLTVVRAGQSMKIALPVHHDQPQLIADLKGAYPSYFIYGPIVFSRATMEFAQLLASNPNALNTLSLRRNPLITQRGNQPDAKREELVVVASPFFPHKLVLGYDNRFSSVVQSINGIPIRSLRHLVATLRDMRDPMITIRFDERFSETIVVPRAAMMEATDAILTDNGIRAQGSNDMLEVWQGKVKN